MSHVFLTILFLVISFLFISTISRLLMTKNEKASDGIHFHGHINIISFCTIIINDDKLVINADNSDHCVVMFSSIVAIKMISYLGGIIVMSIRSSNGNNKRLLLNLDAPNTFIAKIENVIN